MTETVFYLHKNYRVKSKEFRKLLGRLCVGEATAEDAKRIVNLHLTYYKQDETFMANLKQNPKTMWLYARNEDKNNTNLDMLIQTSKNNKMQVARLKKYAHRYLYLYFSRAGGVYKRYFWASASSETCAPGGSYFVYSVFLGVTLAFLMHSLRITLH